MASMIGGIVAISLGAIMLVNVFLTTVHDVNTTTEGFTTAETNLWNILGLVGIIGLVLGVLSVFGVV